MRTLKDIVLVGRTSQPYDDACAERYFKNHACCRMQHVSENQPAGLGVPARRLLQSASDKLPVPMHCSDHERWRGSIVYTKKRTKIYVEV